MKSKYLQPIFKSGCSFVSVWGCISPNLKNPLIIRMPCPTQPPNLNLIENVWRLMKSRIVKRHHRTGSIEEMERVLLEEWDRITSEDYRKYIPSYAATG